jgi:hypothetical protein
MLLEDFVKLDRVSQMVKSTCCSRVDQPMLCQEVGKGEPPKLVPWTCTQGYCSRCELFKRGCEGPRPAEPCTHGQCQLCGVDKLRWRECPIYQASEIPVKALVWEEAERQGTDKEGSQNTQLELTEKVLPFYEVVRLLNDNLERCRRHYGHKEWIRIAKTIDTGWIDRDSLLIFTDFSASMVLRAKAALNSSVDGHAVLAIFVVCYGSRKVTTPAGEKTVNDCDVWYFFGDTKSKGKKNDHVFHNACLKHIVEHYQSKRAPDDPITSVKLWTDNCACQYKCRQNFIKVATFSDSIAGCRLMHRFAVKYAFKGVWDAGGKVVKQMVRNLELKGIRFPHAWALFSKLRLLLNGKVSNVDWEALERACDDKIHDKGPFVVNERFVGLVVEDEDEANRLSNEFRHVIFSDRVNIPDSARIEGTQKLHSVAGHLPSQDTRKTTNGGVTKYRLTVAANPCSCLPCRGLVDSGCPFVGVRDEREEWTSLAVPKAPTAPTEKDEELDRLCVWFESTYATSCTVSNLKRELQELNVKGLSSMRKGELAEKLWNITQSRNTIS